MWLDELHIENCRVIEIADLSLSNKANFIIGDNGAGKTSVIEALSILSQGRSFRTTKIKELINHESTNILVRASGRNVNGLELNMGIERNPESSRIRINKQSIRTQAALSKHLPVSIIHPLSQDLILGGATNRRRYLDWLSFYLHDDFYDLWRRYQALLKQRNAALKDPRYYFSLETLTEQISSIQPELFSRRQFSLSKLKESIEEISPAFLKDLNPILSIKEGLPINEHSSADDIYDFYIENVHKEKERRRTLYGYHLGDLSIKHNDFLVSSTGSRGQIRLITILLILAQNNAIPGNNIIAFDDLSAELDITNQKNLLSFLYDMNAQLIITATSDGLVSNQLPDANMFHVKHGVIT
ncbi:MAG: DNA recombination and repair protein RecF [uncultured Thiotrichaceae bacterium]|uniref:DNA replication and repair protein RecF n=1 Tax=uncultured Thiotrichaceae bacterium TaxID=298394 RepID=A0A6S6TT12_9GAMM|nr:MAG: DNA recombination and repair protein RecF [uncultured Thiotrichaceae bacterium]